MRSAGYRFPVCLAFTGEPDLLRSVVDGAASRGAVRSDRACGRRSASHGQGLLKRTGSLFLSLDELVGDGDGKLSLRDGHTAADVFAEFGAARRCGRALVRWWAIRKLTRTLANRG